MTVVPYSVGWSTWRAVQADPKASPATALALVLIAAVATGCGNAAAENESTAQPVGDLVGGSAAPLAQCRDWNAGTEAEKRATIADIRSFVPGATILWTALSPDVPTPGDWSDFLDAMTLLDVDGFSFVDLFLLTSPFAPGFIAEAQARGFQVLPPSVQAIDQSQHEIDGETAVTHALDRLHRRAPGRHHVLHDRNLCTRRDVAGPFEVHAGAVALRFFAHDDRRDRMLLQRRRQRDRAGDRIRAQREASDSADLPLATVFVAAQ